MTLTRAQVEAALIPRPAKAGPVSLLAGVVTGDRMVDLGDGPLIVDGPTGPVGQEGYVLNVDGHRMWLPFDGASPSHLAAITALTSRVAALETAGPWVDCELGAGVTGSVRVRRLGPTQAEISVNLTGAFATGTSGTLATIPAGLRPTSPGSTIDPRPTGYHNTGFTAHLVITPAGLLTSRQESGATRTTLYARAPYGLG